MTAGADYITNLATYTSDTQTQLTAAHNNVGNLTVFPSILDETPDARAKRAQGTASAMLQQLGQAAKWESEQAGRDGYAAVVGLAKTVAATADAVGKRIKNIVMPTDGNFPTINNSALEELKVLHAALTALGAISPANVWAPPSQK